MKGADAFFPASHTPRQSRNSNCPAWQSAPATYARDPLDRLTRLAGNLAGTASDLTPDFIDNPAGQIAAMARDNNAYAWTDHFAATRAYTADGLNRYGTAGTATFGYDANGNLTGDGSRTFTYDAENRLVAQAGEASAALRYDPLGRLYEVAGASATTRFLYDGDALVAEYNSSGTLLRRHVHNVGADVPLITYEGSDLNTPRWLHADHLGSIVAQSGANGLTAAINAYDEYGIPGAGNTGRFQYTGQIWLPELDMYYYKARVYSPTLGRFMQTDPIGYEGGMNLYAYVLNDPANLVDPSGLTCDVADIQTGDIMVCGRRISASGGGGGQSNANLPPNTLINEKVECKGDSAGEENCEIVVNGRRISLKRGNRRGPGVVRAGNVAAGGCPNGGETQRMNVTAYTNGFESTGKRPGDPGYGVTADGSQAGPGTIAAPRTFPYGTQMYVPGYGLGTVHDRGGAITAGHLDLWFAALQQARQWGRRMVDVQVCR